MDELPVISGGGTDPDGSPDPVVPPSRRRLPVRRLLAVASMAAAILAGVGVARNDRPASAADTLEEIRRFVAVARTVRYTTTLEPRIADGVRYEGVLRFPDRLRGGYRDGKSSSETISLPEGVYDRWADPGEDLDAQHWVYLPPQSKAERYPTGGTDFGEVLSNVGPSLQPGGETIGLIGMLDALERPERVDGDTIVAALPLTALFTDPALSAVMLDGTGSVRVSLTTGPGGRLERLHWHLKARRLTTTAQHCADGKPGNPYGWPSCFDSRQIFRFFDWNVAAAITAPPLDQIDLTPGVDEDALAAAAPALTIAPAWLPADLRLMSIGVTPNAYSGPGACPTVSLDYSAFPSDYAHDARTLRLEISDIACSSTHAHQALRAWNAGERDGHLLRVGGTPDGAWWWISLTLGAANINVDSNLPEAELVDIIDSFGLLDLGAQPVLRSDPPGQGKARFVRSSALEQHQ